VGKALGFPRLKQKKTQWPVGRNFRSSSSHSRRRFHISHSSWSQVSMSQLSVVGNHNRRRDLRRSCRREFGQISVIAPFGDLQHCGAELIWRMAQSLLKSGTGLMKMT